MVITKYCHGQSCHNYLKLVDDCRVSLNSLGQKGALNFACIV